MLGDPRMAEEIDARVKFDIQGEDGGVWIFDCRGQPTVTREDSSADCTVIMSSADLTRIASGDLNPQVAYLQGKIRLEGDYHAALRLSVLMG